MRPENRALLGPDDVVLAAHPGSGASWIAGLLIHLGVFYASGHEELLLDRHGQRTRRWVEDAPRALPELGPARGEERSGRAGRPVIGIVDQQRHLPALIDRDRINPDYREPCRVIKTNQAAVGWAPPNRVLLLVRDGRDAVLSLYHNLKSFSGLDVPLFDYLSGNRRAWLLPAVSWGFSCLSWVGATPPERLHVLRFESCRERPLEEFGALLAFLGVQRTRAEIEHAIEQSSYAAMRRAESAAIEQHGATIGRARVLRRGKVGEWREVYTEEMLRTFRGLPRRALEHFGYPTDTIPT